MLRRASRQTITRLGSLLLPLVILQQTPCHAAALNWDKDAIAGQDANSDGIRDDVASFIQNHWQASDMRFWASEAAKASQAYLTSGGNRFALHRAHEVMSRSRRCLTESYDPQTANSVINRVLRIQLNNYERQQRYKEAVDQWVHKVSREDLPKQPDDDWDPSCGPGSSGTTVVTAAPGITSPRPQATAENEDLPPPNFFITRAMPRNPSKQDGPSASIKVVPLPGAESTEPAKPQESASVATPSTGSWTTYAPRPREKTAETEAENNLRVRKLRQGESAAVAYQPQPATPATVPKPVAVQVTNRPVAQQRKPVEQTVIHPDSRLPAALRELAPFIRDVKQR